MTLCYWQLFSKIGFHHFLQLWLHNSLQNFKNILRVNREYCCLQAYIQAYTHTYRHTDDSTPNILKSFDSKMVNKLLKNELYRYLMSQFYDYVNFHSFTRFSKLNAIHITFCVLVVFVFFVLLDCTGFLVHVDKFSSNIKRRIFEFGVRQNFLLKNIKSSMLGERPTWL